MKKSLNVMELIPEISQISNPDIRNKTIEVWQRMWEKSKFQDIMDVPVTPRVNYPHIPHNRSLIQMALKVADVIEEFHGVSVDKDFLLSAAILQDASKLVEFEPSPEGVIFSETGEQFPHAFYAAHMALEVGLPNEIAQSILTHTFDNPVYPPSLISKILFYVDQIDMAALGGDRWRKMSVVYR